MSGVAVGGAGVLVGVGVGTDVETGSNSATPSPASSNRSAGNHPLSPFAMRTSYHIPSSETLTSHPVLLGLTKPALPKVVAGPRKREPGILRSRAGKSGVAVGVTVEVGVRVGVVVDVPVEVGGGVSVGTGVSVAVLDGLAVAVGGRGVSVGIG